MKRKETVLLFVALIALLSFPMFISAEEEKEEDAYSIPSHVLDISKENTQPNNDADYESIESSELTQELLTDAELNIDNADLIKLLNETTIDPSPVAFGYRGMIYLGRWPLEYESEDTTVNWEYQSINKNEINNLGSSSAQTITYNQQETKELKGTLLNKIIQPDVVRKMILEKTKEKTDLPLAYKAVIGKNTKKDNTYQVPVEKHGVLEAYAPAVKESGKVTYGEVYIELKGSNKHLVVKNVTRQEVSAWLPIQNHVSFSFQLQ